MCLCLRVLNVFACTLACENSAVKKGERLKGPVWKQPMQSYATFSLSHAKTCGRSGISPIACNLFDAMANLNAPSNSTVLSVKALHLCLAVAC